MSRPIRSPESRFWSKVDITTDINACWLWKGGQSKGYGKFWYEGKYIPAHKMACKLVGKPIPSDVLGCHSCDVRLCVNPRHVFPGTQKDNMQDWTKKGKNKLIEGSARPFTHWMKTSRGKKLISDARKREIRIGHRITIRNDQGQFAGSRMR